LGRRGRWCDSSYPDRETARPSSGCSSGVRARGRGPRGRWCDSSHPDRRHRPKEGHETTNFAGWGSIPLGGTDRYTLDVAQQQSAWVTTTMSLVQSQSSRLPIDRLPHTTVPWRDTILRRSLAEVRILSVVRFLRRRLGRSWIPTPRSSVRFTGDVPFLLLRVVQQPGRSVRIREIVGASPAT
jgi:hypothetical protein